MSCWLDYQSPYFHSLNLTVDQAETVQSLIDSAIECVEKYCNRNFLKAEHDDVFTALRDGSIVLDNPPISYVTRICTGTGGWLIIENTSSSVTNATFAVSDDSLILTRWVAGVKTTNTLTLASYATLNLLAAAITNLGNGWSASTTSGYGNYPSADLVPQQHGYAKAENTIYSWEDYTGSFDFNGKTGVIDGYFAVGTKFRVVYVGGFIDVPEPIKQLTANMVIPTYTGQGKITTESLGGYSYSIDSLPISDKQILAYYRDRRC